MTFDIFTPQDYIGDDALRRSWAQQTEEEKYAEWSEYAELHNHNAFTALSYVEYCNSWES